MADFAKAVELAEGEYFSWLQDDDLIHVDFVRRALESFARAPDIASIRASGSTITRRHRSTGRPSSGRCSMLTGWAGRSSSWTASPWPLLHIINIATFPMVAFRTDVLRRAVRHVLLDCELFNENMVMAAVLGEGRLAIDPWIAAFHSAHENQASRIMVRDRDELRRQWRLLASFFEGFLPQLPAGWEQAFKQAVSGISVRNRVHLLNWATTCAGDWGTTPEPTRALRDMVIESIPTDQRHMVPTWVTAPWTPIKRMKQRLRKVTPGMIQRMISAVRRLIGQQCLFIQHTLTC